MLCKKAGQPSVKQCGPLSGPSNTAKLQTELHSLKLAASALKVLQQYRHITAAVLSPLVHVLYLDSHCQHNNDASCIMVHYALPDLSCRCNDFSLRHISTAILIHFLTFQLTIIIT